MDDNQNNKRSVWSYILPYLLIAATVVLIVIFAVRNLFSTPTEWKKNQLNTLLRTDEDSTSQTTINESAVYLRTVNVSQGYQATTVSGTAVKVNSREVYSYKVIIENNDWNVNKFTSYMYSKTSDDLTIRATSTNAVP